MRRIFGLGVIALGLGQAVPAGAVFSTRSVPSSLGGNGHNVSFDGRLYLIRTGIGWQARVLRPEGVTLTGDGLPDAEGPMWSPAVTILTGPDPAVVGENALAICEDDPERAPFACDADGQPAAGGDFDCYDVWVIDSDASRTVEDGGSTFRRRALTVRVADPRTATATIADFSLGAPSPLAVSGGGALHGIEPTVTADGRLMVWNGSLDNGNSQDSLMYVVNASACALGGWSAPRSLSEMATDDAVIGRYRLADRTLRAADGTAYADGAAIKGAYPWLLPAGDGVMFSAASMPCRDVEDPPGCGPRRNATSFLGYPTNWGLAVVDGGINPSTTDTVRLFFSSPGPDTFPQLPVSEGDDVWPFFGSNTSNYIEVSFDDGLDGDYAGFWHMNEVVDVDGNLDGSRAADVSGYFNTAVIPPIPVARDLLGAVDFPGSGAGAAITDDGTLGTTAELTLQMTVRPASDPDCDGLNNWRVLAIKGDWGTQAYSVVLEEGRWMQARVYTTTGTEYAVASPVALPIGVATPVGVRYEAATGDLALYVGGREVARTAHPPAALRTAAGPLYVGGPGTARPACPDGLGTFAGQLDDVDVSTIELTPGAVMPAANNGWLGKAVELDGERGWLEVAHAASLEPVNGITVEMVVRPDSDPDCDGANNYRVLAAKGTAYSLVLEEPRGVRFRIAVEGGERELYSGAALPIGAWTRVAAEYDGASGVIAIFFDGVEVARDAGAPATLVGDGSPLYLGGRGPRDVCPDGDGVFHGALDEVAISRFARTLGAPPDPPDAGAGDGPDADGSGGGGDGDGGGGCCGAGGGRGEVALAALVLLFIASRRRRLLS